jgi:eukaryotic-like serine/threonine-protein kinase
LDGNSDADREGIGMGVDQSDRACRIFAAALEVDEALRESYVATACAGDAELARQVGELLSNVEASDRYFSALRDRLGVERWMPGLEAATASTAEPQLEGIGSGVTIGHYRLLHRIGAGGMGTVWSAERSDGRYDGRVAIKFLAASERPDALARFAREGRLLAKLDHPNIARLIDADIGPAGRPYLVLEYVQGEAIDRYCDSHSLTIAQRIRLFDQVVEAISHAHQHLVIHRDIKPGNVTVTGEGVVKVLDFGISKLLHDDGNMQSLDLTQQMGTVLTPQFAAPEQIAGAEVTTATDVFALGMLLWRLLTDVTPRSGMEVRSVAQLRALATRDPVSLVECLTQSTQPDVLREVAARRGTNSTAFLRTLRGDIDGILRKATSVEPRDRYATARDFAADLRRLLNDEPVLAHAQTTAYRLRKFVRRHRGGVGAAVLTLLAVLSSLGVALWQGNEARRQRDFAREQHARAQLTNEFTSFILTDVGSPTQPITMTDLLARAEVMLERQASMAGAPHGPALYELATVYFSLGQQDKLTQLLERAVTIAHTQGDSDLLAASQCTLGRVWLRTEPARGRAAIVQGLRSVDLVRLPSADAFVSCERARALLAEADAGRDDAAKILRAALRTVKQEHPGLRPRLFLLNELSRIHYDDGALAASLAINEEILAAMKGAGLDRSTGYAVNLINRSLLLQSIGQVLQASLVQREVFDELRHLPVSAGFERPFSGGRIRLARYDDALAALASGEAAMLAAGDPFALAEHRLLEGRALMFLGRQSEASAKFDQVDEVLRQAPRRYERIVNALELARAQSLLLQGDAPEARIRIGALLSRLGYPESAKPAALLHPLMVAGLIELRAGDAAAARRYADAALQSAQALAQDSARSADVGQALLLRAKARRSLADVDGARQDLALALGSLEKGLGVTHPDVVEARELLALR